MRMSPQDVQKEQELQKQKEFNIFVKNLAMSCFEDCVTDFTGKEMRQTESERTCIKNCASQQLKMHSSLAEVEEELN